MPHVELKTEQTYQREAKPCAECQRYARQIALAYQLGEPEVEVSLRQDWQRHKAIEHGEVK